MKGLLALDLDGTLTGPDHLIPKEVVDYLTHLQKSGWAVAFITGRSFQRARSSLEEISFPYSFAVYNGSLILNMPDQTLISRAYLGRSLIPSLDKLFEAEPFDFILYAGYEDEDRTYYRSSRFSPPYLDYVRRRASTFKETFIDVADFHDLPVHEFASIKCFVDRTEASRISRVFDLELGLHAPMIRDPFQWDYYAVQATHPASHKGAALSTLIGIYGNVPTIAAGDDFNDMGMIELADVGIAMATAPDEVKKVANLIAPIEGIIPALEEAIRRL